ncbi:hypothetical protein GQS65_05050, partial [Halomarina oriensis]|nr:hypothetical protein [Halomarina oriensis]
GADDGDDGDDGMDDGEDGLSLVTVQIECGSDGATVTLTNPNDQAVTVELSGDGSGSRTIEAGESLTLDGVSDGRYTVATVIDGETLGTQSRTVDCVDDDAGDGNDSDDGDLLEVDVDVTCDDAGATVTVTNENDVTVTADVGGRIVTLAPGENVSYDGVQNGEFDVTTVVDDEAVGTQTVVVDCPDDGAPGDGNDSDDGTDDGDVVQITAEATCTADGGDVTLSNTNDANVTVEVSGDANRTLTFDAGENRTFSGLGDGEYTLTTVVGGEVVGTQTIVVDCADDGAPGDGDDGANVTVDCTEFLVETDLENVTAEVDVLDLGTNETRTLTVQLNGTTNVSLGELDGIADIGVDAALIEEIRVLDDDGDVLAVDSNDDLSVCIELLGIDIADIDTDLALDLGLLENLQNGTSDDELATLTAELNNTQLSLLDGAIEAGDVDQTDLSLVVDGLDDGSLDADELTDALLSGNVGDALDDLLGGDDGTDDFANVTTDCTEFLVETNLENVTVELDLLRLSDDQSRTITAEVDGNTTVSLGDLDQLAGVNLDTVLIEEVRVLDENGTVVDVASNDDLSVCIELLGIDIADIDTDLALDLGLLTDLQDGTNDSELATLTAELNNTQLSLLDGAIEAGDVTDEELSLVVDGLDDGSLDADELTDALLSGNVGDALDDLLGGLLP